MSDREFIELLNLYVDREISPEDALRLEAEVARNPGRREVYDQYCRIQKACSMLSEESFEVPAAHPVARLVSFPAPSAWRFGAFATGLAAAAAVAVTYLGIQNKQAALSNATDATSQVRSVAESASARADSGSPAMKPVFFVSLPVEQAPAASRRISLEAPDAASEVAQLSWIGDIHMSPVPASSADFLLGGKSDLKAAVVADPQSVGQDKEPLEMTAFRFQR